MGVVLTGDITVEEARKARKLEYRTKVIKLHNIGVMNNFKNGKKSLKYTLKGVLRGFKKMACEYVENCGMRSSILIETVTNDETNKFVYNICYGDEHARAQCSYRRLLRQIERSKATSVASGELISIETLMVPELDMFGDED